MTTELATYQPAELPALTAQQVRARVNLVQQVMRGVMKEGTHYGRIPGAGDKPSLLKPGAETLAVTFRIAIDPLVDDLSTADEARYRVLCRGVHQDTGMLLGTGVGEASSNEEKYRWRRAVCDEEYDETPDDRRRIKWSKGKGGSAYKTRQVRTNPADVANTILKMAKKRAQIDMTLSVTGASDLFTQDIEDLPREYWTETPRPHTDEPVVCINSDQLAELLDLAELKGLSSALVQRQLAAKRLYSGPLESMPEDVFRQLMAGLSKMPDKTYPDDEPQAVDDIDGVA